MEGVAEQGREVRKEKGEGRPRWGWVVEEGAIVRRHARAVENILRSRTALQNDSGHGKREGRWTRRKTTGEEGGTEGGRGNREEGGGLDDNLQVGSEGGLQEGGGEEARGKKGEGEGGESKCLCLTPFIRS